MELFSFLNSSRRKRAEARRKNAAGKNRPRKFEALEDRRVLSAMPTPLALEPIATYRTGIFDDSATEIVAYDPEMQQLYSTNLSEHTIDVLKLSSLRVPHYREAPGPSDVPSIPNGHVKQVDMTGLLDGTLTSVTTKNGLVAVSAGQDPGLPGQVALFRSAHKGLEYIQTVEVGAGPDKVAFSPDGTKVVVANEGSPSEDYSIDPEGSVSIIDVSSLLDDDETNDAATVTTATFEAFNGQEDALRESGVRIYGPGATVAQDLEPEFVTISEDSKLAFIALQDNNAIATLDLETGEFVSIEGLGFKDHLLEGNGLDASNKDKAINIVNWPVQGMYQPDGIANYTVDGETFLLTANEGSGRDEDGFSEETRVGSEPEVVVSPDLGENQRLDLSDVSPLSPDLIAEYPELADKTNLGRLKVTVAEPATFVETTVTVPVVVDNPDDENPDLPPDGTPVLDAEENPVTQEITVRQLASLYAFGARSFSIWTQSGEQVYDSGDDFEQITAALDLAAGDDSFLFNATNDENKRDGRSDDKGPEPSNVKVGQIGESTYAFITLERVGGVMVYNVTDPTAPTFETYVNNRDFSVDILVEVDDDEVPGPNWQDAGDLHVEGLVFISADQSPTGSPLVVTANEVSGTVTIFQVGQQVDYSADFGWSGNQGSKGSKKDRAKSGGGWASAVDMMMSLV
ncbi:MAG: choice-of-anchor I family protein [Thermoguttaceae bacterium]